MSINAPVAMSPALEAYYRDVLTVAEVILDDADTGEHIREAFNAPALDIDAIDFQVKVPSASVAGASAALDIVRLATDAAYVALNALDDRDLLTIEGVESLLLDSMDSLLFLDAGFSSFWGKLRRTVLSSQARDAAGPYVMLVVVALGVVAALAGAPVVLAAVAAALPGIDPLWELATRAANQRDARLASINEATVESTEVEMAAERTFVVTAPVWGTTSNLLRFRDRMVAATALVRSADITPAEDEGDAIVAFELSDSLAWGDVRAIAEEFLLKLGDPSLART